MQERKQIEQVSKGMPGIEAVQVLAPIMQLHPEILVEQEDTAEYSRKKDSWIWLVMGKTIYLCSP